MTAAPERSALVLVVDDDSGFASALSRLLEGRGYRTICANTSRHAVQVLEAFRERIDLVIVDLVLDDQSGYELIGALRRRPNSIKIIAISGILRESELYLARRIGADETLQKPCGGSTLPREEWLATIAGLVPPRVAETGAAGSGRR